jgi:hypothetical protein
MSASVLEPSRKLPVLFFGEGRVQVFYRYVGRRDQHRLGVRKRVEAVFPMLVADAGGPGAAKRHGLDEQVYIHQVHATPTEG